MNKEGITVAGNLIADVVYTIDVYPQKGIWGTCRRN